MQIKRQNLQKKSYQTDLFCNFQKLKPSYFAYFATINCTKKNVSRIFLHSGEKPRSLPRQQARELFKCIILQKQAYQNALFYNSVSF